MASSSGRKSSLPIDPILPELVAHLERANSLVLRAAPGSGKTTRVPPALLDAAFARDREIWVLEPRRLAAKYSARRVAWELGEDVGKTVGYQFRFENVGSAATRLRFLTEGTLIRRLQADRDLKRVAAVLLDEFHERHLMTDTALAYLKHLQNERRPDLRLVVMSATLDTDSVRNYLGSSCSVLEVSTRPFPVEIAYRGASTQPLEAQVRGAVHHAIDEDAEARDILVFLPGMAEIRRAEQALSDLARTTYVLPLHGDLSKEEQDRALTPLDRRKVILSTNLAETSLTVEGVNVVVDSGLHRQAAYSWWSGMPALKTRPISRASAIQRAGRAGRTSPGRCYRLYSEGDFGSRPPFETPEIQRADLTQNLLEIRALGIESLARFPWFEAPSPQSIESSWRLLYLLGAIEAPSDGAKITELGEAIARFPAHPRVSRFLIESCRLGVRDSALTLACWMTEARLEKLDILDHLQLAGADSFRRSRQQFSSALASPHAPAPPAFKSVEGELRSPTFSTEDALRFALLTGFPDRVARARGKEPELVFCGGGSAQLQDTSSLYGHGRGSKYFVVLDVQEQKHLNQARSRPRVHSLSRIEEEWLIELSPSLLSERDEYTWDPARERVVRSSALRYGELALTETTEPAPPGPEAASVLLRVLFGTDRAALERATLDTIGDLFAKTGGNQEALHSAIARVRALAEHYPLRSSAEAMASLLAIFESRVSREEVLAVDWGAELLQAFAPDAAPRIEQLLPSFLTLPSGRRTRIHYAAGKSPWVESRLQDFFGMKAAPSLLNGKLPLTLHLLAPNQRAVQITTDLASFWKKDYPALRPALSRRYPKHAWPEDPLSASSGARK